ncbi:hypothetical protein NicSoilC12_04000 [Arthrobacter sp. NicSoilC12]|nr:hypothetical protein NicSoilC12_04000 [Arthrobacter sp. NicSoilC12]
MIVAGVVALVLIGLNLRAGITGAAALFHDLQAVLGYGPLIAALLPSIPTLCFAVAGAATSWLTRQLGLEKAILLSLVMLAAGLLLRGVPSTGMLLAGTVAGMSGLAICNVAMPSFIRVHFADRTSLMTAVYTLTMTTGATATAVLIVPVAQALGSPSAGVGAIGFLALGACLGFLPIAVHAHRNASPGKATRVSPWPLLRTRTGAMITLGFTVQALLAYAVLSWFPYMLATTGLSASDSGLMFGLMQLVSVPAGMVLVAIGSRPRMLRTAFYLATVTMALGVLSMLVAPTDWAPLTAVLLGFGLGIFPLVMVMISRSGRSTAETTALSTVAQSAGYLLATLGPFGMGLLHSATNSWTLPLALLLAVALGQIAVGHLLSAGPKELRAKELAAKKLRATAPPRPGRNPAMTLTASHRPPLAEEITAKLRALIHSGEWPLQQRIPAEPELMAAFGVSRGTLREAIKALAHSGMLEVRRGDGTYVRATSEIAGATQRMYEDHSQEHILEVRVGLDTQAARLAARHATADDLTALRGLLTARRAAWLAEDYAAWARADWDFHARVAEASANPLLHELYVSFGSVFHNDLLRQQRRGGFNGLPHEGHDELVAAIAARDEAAAVESVTRNLNSCAEWLQD